jgi:CRISPR-associated protein Cas2
MVVVVVEAVSQRLRGHLRRFLIEVGPGTYVGQLSGRVRDRLWTRVVDSLDGGRAVMVAVRAGEQGFEIRVEGFRDRQVVDFDGIQLTRILTVEN